MKKYFAFAIGLFLCLGIRGQAVNEVQLRYYEAYLLNELPALKAAIRDMEEAYRQSPSPDKLLALAKAEYGAIGACFAKKDNKTARQLLDKAAKRTKTLLEQEPSGESHALYTGILGMKIALSPIKGPFLGKQSVSHAKEAVKLDPQNAFVLLQYGNNLYYTPPAFGGDLTKAIENYRLAIEKYQGQSIENNWEYLLCLAMLGQALEAQGAPNAALETYQKALATAPDYAWVKHELLPKLKESSEF